MLLRDHLRHAVEVGPGREAIVVGEASWTYQQFDDLTGRIACSLAKTGIQKGDRVALQLSNSVELVLSYYACFKLGAIAVPINNRFVAPELEYTLNHSESRVCITQNNLYRNVAPIRKSLTSVERFYLVDDSNDTNDVNRFTELLETSYEETSLPPLDPDDVAAILYTSGTTARPKGVTHTNRSLEATAHFTERWWAWGRTTSSVSFRQCVIFWDSQHNCSAAFGPPQKWSYCQRLTRKPYCARSRSSEALAWRRLRCYFNRLSIIQEIKIFGSIHYEQSCRRWRRRSRVVATEFLRSVRRSGVGRLRHDGSRAFHAELIRPAPTRIDWACLPRNDHSSRRRRGARRAIRFHR